VDDKTFLAQVASMDLENETSTIDIHGFVIECRRGEAYNPLWWQTAIEQGEKVGRMPCLAYQLGGSPWIARLFAQDIIGELFGSRYVVELDLDALMLLLARRSESF